MKMKNKKAIVLPETLKIIIGVLCILILIYLAWSLYSMFIVKSKLTQAKETLKEIADKINGLGDREIDDYLVVAPKGWALMARGKKTCICNLAEAIYGSEEFSDCVKAGVCTDLNYELKISHSFGGISGCFLFRELPIKLFFIRNGEYINLKTAGDLTIEKNLEDILKYKKDENSKSVNELVFEYLEASENKEKVKIRDQINSILKDFFSKLDTKSLFDLEKRDFAWKFEVFKKEEENYILRIDKEIVPSAELTEIVSTTIEFEGNNEYFANLTYYSMSYMTSPPAKF